MPNFAQKVEHAVDALSGTNDRQVNEGDFIGASQMVIDHVREIRKAVLTNRVRVAVLARATRVVLITIKSYLYYVHIFSGVITYFIFPIFPIFPHIFFHIPIFFTF